MPSHAATKTVYLLSSAVLDSVELPGLAALAHNDGFTYELGVCVCKLYQSDPSSQLSARLVFFNARK